MSNSNGNGTHKLLWWLLTLLSSVILGGGGSYFATANDLNARVSVVESQLRFVTQQNEQILDELRRQGKR